MYILTYWQNRVEKSKREFSNKCEERKKKNQKTQNIQLSTNLKIGYQKKCGLKNAKKDIFWDAKKLETLTYFYNKKTSCISFCKTFLDLKIKNDLYKALFQIEHHSVKHVLYIFCSILLAIPETPSLRVNPIFTVLRLRSNLANPCGQDISPTPEYSKNNYLHALAKL